MSLELRRYAPSDLETLRRLVRDPSFADQFDSMLGPNGLEAFLADPYLKPETVCLALADGEPAAFSMAFVPPSREGRFAMVRIGVLGRFRRQGAGSRLLERVCRMLRQGAPNLVEICVTAWLPADAAVGFAAHHGFQPVRKLWLMERPRGTPPPIQWPAGIERVVFDGSDTLTRDCNDAFNDSFAHHYHSGDSTFEEARAFLSRPGLRRDGLLLAYRDGRCVGFCRGELHERRGEIAVLGTIQAARGIGLGRALLRWGVAWLERENAPRVTLMVDGENETALRLYRGEGFEVTRTRESWARAPRGEDE
ncbi:MAG: GNAT family N-acetyltransferase [Candidatus Eisenbacteria bacterium]|nr:GNAT family N-acetyltransferase [Candidatus Eisenbacteria bacterium]